MKTLKTLRLERGLAQPAVAKEINCTISQLSLYEQGADAPMIEDCINLENYFGEPIDWTASEILKPNAKANYLLAFNLLCRRYPLSAVLNFMKRCISIDSKTGKSDGLVTFFCAKMQHGEEDILLPPDVR